MLNYKIMAVDQIQQKILQKESKLNNMRAKSYEVRSVCKSFNSDQRARQSSIKQGVEELQSHFKLFTNDKNQQNLRHVMQVLSEDVAPQVIPCRQKQIADIEGFILDAINMTYSPEVLYIAGVPGIGKTICVKDAIRRIQKKAEFSQSKVKFIYVNAMKIRQPQDIFKSILGHLTDVPVRVDSAKACYQLNDYFQKGISTKQIKVSPSVTKILVIDEMDYLKTVQQQVIYTIVEWIRNKKSHLAIIGISNTIDLPQSFSLKIASRFGNRRCIFPQYTIKQIGEILGQRLSNCTGVFSDDAITYICSKIGGQQTDIRKCLHILRQSISRHLGIEKFKRKSQKVYVCDVPEYTVKEVVRDLYYDSFVDSFPQFPYCYKVVMAAIASYFRQEKQAMAYSQLGHILGEGLIKNINQLRSILYDLRDLGLISIRYMVLKADSRFHREFKLSKNVQEEFINLLVDVDKVMIAIDAEDRENGKVNSHLERCRNYFVRKY